MKPLLAIVGAVLLVYGLTAGSLHAQAWVRLHVTTPQGTFAGSGAVVSVSGQTAAILTAAHVVKDQTGGTVELASGAVGQITQTYLDRHGYDLALVIADCRGELPTPIQLGEWREGQQAAWHGYGSGAYATASGLTSTGSGVPEGWPAQDAVLATPCRSGDSGGPIVDSAGRLIGVVWGCEAVAQPDGTQVPVATHFAPITPVRDFLRRCFGQQPWAAAGAACPNGMCPPADPNGWRSVTPPNQPAAPILPPPIEAPAATPTLPNPPSPPPTPEIKQAPSNPLLEVAAVAGSSIATLLLGPLGGAGAGALAARWIAGRAIRRIASRKPFPPDRQPPITDHPLRTERYDSPSVIPVDTPPRTIHAKTETHYVPIDDPKFDRAYAWAVEQIKRKYPGGSDLLEPLDSLIRQHLNAQKASDR